MGSICFHEILCDRPGPKNYSFRTEMTKSDSQLQKRGFPPDELTNDLVICNLMQNQITVIKSSNLALDEYLVCIDDFLKNEYCVSQILFCPT